MNKVMLVVLILVCAFGCIMWSFDAYAKSSTHKRVSTKKSPAKTKAAIKTKAKSAIKTKINPKDGAEMVLIPAGEFLMGTSEKELAAWQKINKTYKREMFLKELPQHKVYLDAYYMYKTEVTVAQYRKFCKVTKRDMPEEPSWKWQDNHPIVNVSWYDAKAYAKWVGAVLPSEAQWEKAARGTDGHVFPWGNDWDARKCVIFGNSQGTKPVGSILAGASPYGVLDMAGNVSEWCADWYGVDYYKNAPMKNPTGPKTGDNRVVKGGSWHSSNIYGLGNRGASRYNDNPRCYSYGIIGFRCAVSSLGK